MNIYTHIYIPYIHTICMYVEGDGLSALGAGEGGGGGRESESPRSRGLRWLMTSDHPHIVR